jgi:N-methylhydantoinase A
MARRIRIGVDVGGTFTKAIAVDMINGSLLGKVTVPTSHSSVEGVSEGILSALTALIRNQCVDVSEIELISHSTTQAVNALLEGDTSKVGIIGMGVGLERSNVVKRTAVKDVELAPNKYLKTCYRFLDTSRFLDEKEVINAISELKDEGASVLVVSEAYGVDDPSNELFVMEKSSIPATGGHELTGIYGLEIRTLTAAINAGILLKSITTAKFVESAIERQGITAPLVIMKGDGGITDMKTFKSKPILTILSGPAASIAGALLHLKILNGIFIEVGGTSTNVCIIKNGRPEVKYVTIMNHPTCIKSLDVRVVGVAGGSLIRWSGKKIVDVGPRSAHISGLMYSCYAEPQDIEGGQIITFMPKEGDPMDYLAIESAGGKRFAITTTCAANALDIIPEKDYAKGNQESAKLALSILALRIGVTTEQVANTILDLSARKVLDIVNVLIRDYKVKSDRVVLIGGGGAASVLVPRIAEKINKVYKIPEHAEVISSIGVAAAMIREEQEKTISNPSSEEVSNIIKEVENRVISKGAVPESVTIQSEYISERSLLRVIAYGNMSLDIGTVNAKQIDDQEARILACELFGINDGIRRVYDMKNYYIFACKTQKKKLFLKSPRQAILVLDKYGKVRLSVENGEIYNGSPQELSETFFNHLKEYINGAKSNELAPQIHILDGTRIIDFSSLTSPEQLLKAVREELVKTNNNEITIIIKI